MITAAQHMVKSGHVLDRFLLRSAPVSVGDTYGKCRHDDVRYLVQNGKDIANVTIEVLRPGAFPGLGFDQSNCNANFLAPFNPREARRSNRATLPPLGPVGAVRRGIALDSERLLGGTALAQ